MGFEVFMSQQIPALSNLFLIHHYLMRGSISILSDGYKVDTAAEVFAQNLKPGTAFAQFFCLNGSSA